MPGGVRGRIARLFAQTPFAEAEQGDPGDDGKAKPHAGAQQAALGCISGEQQAKQSERNGADPDQPIAGDEVFPIDRRFGVDRRERGGWRRAALLIARWRGHRSKRRGVKGMPRRRGARRWGRRDEGRRLRRSSGFDGEAQHGDFVRQGLLADEGINRQTQRRRPNADRHQNRQNPHSPLH